MGMSAGAGGGGGDGVNNVLLHVAVLVFGVGSWLAINGIFSELAFLVQTAPEGWNLAPGVVLTIQLANIVPFVYCLSVRFFHFRFREVRLIYLILTVGCVSSLLLAVLCNSTLVIDGAEKSLYLYVLTFCVALVDCTSSITYFPFLSRFPDRFVTSLMVGEGLSAFIPSALALLQNAGLTRQPIATTPSSSGVTWERANTSSTAPAVINTTNGVHFYCYTDSRFSENVYFFLLFVLYVLSSAAFVTINKWPTFRAIKTRYKEPEAETASDETMLPSGDTSDDELSGLKAPPHMTSDGGGGGGRRERKGSVWMFVLLFCACFAANGALPSISTYTLLPYGNHVMLLTINLGNLTNPLTCLVLFFAPCASILVASLTTGACLVLAAGLAAIALQSPSPPLVDAAAGWGFLLVLSLWVAFFVAATVSRLVIANRCRREGKDSLLLYGVVTQVGSFSGALLMFLLCTYTPLFTAAASTC